MEAKSPAISLILTGFLMVLIVLGIFLEISDWEKWALAIPVILGTGFLLFFEKKYLIYLTVFLIPFSFSYQLGEGITLTLPAEIMIVVLAAVFLIYLLFNPQLLTHQLWSHPVSLWIYLDLALGLLAVMNSEIPLVSLKRWIAKLMFVAVFFFMIGIWFSRKEMYQKVLLLWGLGLVGIVLFTLFQHSQYRMGIPYAPAMSRPFFDDHTIYGANLAMFIPLMGLLWLNGSKTGLSSPGKWLLSGLLLIFLAGVFFSFSRAVWLSLAIVLFLGGMRKLVNVIKWNRSRIIMGMGLTMIVVILGVMMTGNWIKNNRAQSVDGSALEHLSSSINIQSNTSNLERMNRWLCAIRLFQERPVLGWGPGTYQHVYGPFQKPEEMTRISTYEGNMGNAHSEYLTYLSESGILGLIGFLGLIFTIFFTAFSAYRRADRQRKIWLLGLLFGLITFLFHGLVNSFLDQVKIAGLFYVFLAIIVRIDLQTRNLTV